MGAVLFFALFALVIPYSLNAISFKISYLYLINPKHSVPIHFTIVNMGPDVKQAFLCMGISMLVVASEA